MWYTINVSGAKICQLDPVEDKNMNILTCSPNNFITAAPPPRRSHAPHPCRGNLASRPGGLAYRESRPGGLSYGETLAPRWRADDADAPEIRITPPPPQTLTITFLCKRRQTEHPLGQRSRKRAPKGLFVLHRIPSWTMLLQGSLQGAIRVAPR